MVSDGIMEEFKFSKCFGDQVVCRFFKSGQLLLSTFPSQGSGRNCPALFTRPWFSVDEKSSMICTDMLVSNKTSAYDMFMGRLKP